MAFEDQYTDHHLFRLIAGGDQAAFAELFRRWDKRIYPFVLRMIRSEALAEEIAHEIFIKLWNSREKLAVVDQPEAYILTVASRHTLDHIRRRLNEARMLRRLSERRSEGHNDTEEELLMRDRAALLAQAVEQLPPQQKMVYRLSREEGLDYERIGEQMNISSNTVRNHLVKALQFIREYMRDQDMLSIAVLASALLLIKK